MVTRSGRTWTAFALRRCTPHRSSAPVYETAPRNPSHAAKPLSRRSPACFQLPLARECSRWNIQHRRLQNAALGLSLWLRWEARGNARCTQASPLCLSGGGQYRRFCHSPRPRRRSVCAGSGPVRFLCPWGEPCAPAASAASCAPRSGGLSPTASSRSLRLALGATHSAGV